MTPKTKLILILSVLYLFVASSALGFVLYEVHSAGNELENRIARIGERNAKLKMYNELSRLIEETQEQRAELATYVLTEERTSAFLTEIEMQGAKRGVQLATESLTVVPQNGTFDDLNVKLKLEGTDRAVKEMIATLEALPYHSTVSAVVLAKEPTGTVSGSVQLTLSLGTYE